MTLVPLFTLRTLGSLRLRGSSGELLAGRRKELALLAYLVRRAPAPVSRASLATLLWGERGEERARNSLRQALFQLRRALGDAIVVEAERVHLVADAVQLDLALFEADFAAGRFAEAVARCEGEFLAGVDDYGAEGFDAWVVQERVAAGRRLATAFERLVSTAEHRGAFAEGVAWAERWLGRCPTDERAATRLIEMLRFAGRHDEAMARHAAFETLSRVDLGCEPSAAFAQLGRVQPARAIPVAPTPGSAALFTPDLVGRREAIETLLAAWHAARDGHGTSILVEGEMGVGRTRLHDALRHMLLRESPALILTARGLGGDGESKWSVARELLSPLQHVASLGGLAPEMLAELRAIVPSIADRFTRLGHPAGNDAALAAAVRQALEVVAEDTPVALLVDDVHRADPASRRLLVSLAHRPPPHVFIVFTLDIDGLADAPELAALRESRQTARVRLRALAIGEVEAMLASMLDLDDDERGPLAARLHGQTGGNPFWISEHIAALVDTGRLVHDGLGPWRVVAPANDELPLPASAREIIGWRLARLGAESRAVLRAAAALGAPITHDALVQTSGLRAEAVDAAVDELVALRILRLRNDGAALEFAHALILRATREQLPAARGGTRAPSRRWRHVASALVAAGAIALIALAQRPWSRAGQPTLMVGSIHVAGTPDSIPLAATLRELLATDLAQVPGAHLVAAPRRRTDGHILDAVDIAAAAQRAGVERLVEGTLSRLRTDEWRLDVRVVEVGSGAIAGAHTVEGRDVFALVDDATSAVANVVGLRQAGVRIADVTTRSLTAYRFYEEGLRAYYAGEVRGAHRLFTAALREDTAFAMAAFYASRTVGQIDESWALHERAMRLAARATDRERLLIVGSWAAAMDEPRRLAIAETLAVRYPNDPDGHLLLGQAKLWAGDFLGAVAPLRRVIEMKPASGARCVSCDAFNTLASAYSYADSLEAAERTIWEWIRAYPSAAEARIALAGTLEQQSRFDAALAALAAADSIAPGQVDVAGQRAGIAMRRGDFDAVDRMWSERLASGDRTAREAALWSLTISYRTQGRLGEARSAAQRFRTLQDGRLSGALPEALVLLESGAPRSAAAIFDSSGRATFSGRSRARDARARLWNLVHLATAQVRAGDTTQLARLADTVEHLGRESAFGRDQRAHHHVRGLLFAARGRWPEAAAAYRRALFSPWGGYVRTNVELGRALLHIGRAREAIPVLDAALRGPIGASGLYATRSELQVLLGEAYEAVGRIDSATVSYERAVAAWRMAEGPVRGERDRVRARLVALQRNQ